MRYSLIVLGVSVCLLATNVHSADKPDQDKEKLQGTWVVESWESGLFKSKPKKKLTYTFAGNKLTIKDEGKADDQRTYTMDASKKPKEIDLVDAKKLTMKAAYDLDGDTLRIAYPPMADKRPAAIDAKEATIYTLKRDKK